MSSVPINHAITQAQASVSTAQGQASQVALQATTVAALQAAAALQLAAGMVVPQAPVAIQAPTALLPAPTDLNTNIPFLFAPVIYDAATGVRLNVRTYVFKPLIGIGVNRTYNDVCNRENLGYEVEVAHGTHLTWFPIMRAKLYENAIVAPNGPVTTFNDLFQNFQRPASGFSDTHRNAVTRKIANGFNPNGERVTNHHLNATNGAFICGVLHKICGKNHSKGNGQFSIFWSFGTKTARNNTVSLRAQCLGCP